MSRHCRSIHRCCLPLAVRLSSVRRCEVMHLKKGSASLEYSSPIAGAVAGDMSVDGTGAGNGSDDGAGAGAGAGAAAAADSATASASERLRLELAETAAARRHPQDRRRWGRRSTRYQTPVLGAADARGIVSTACDERATARSYTEASEADQAQRRPLTYGRPRLRHAFAPASALALEGVLARLPVRALRVLAVAQVPAEVPGAVASAWSPQQRRTPVSGCAHCS